MARIGRAGVRALKRQTLGYRPVPTPEPDPRSSSALPALQLEFRRTSAAKGSLPTPKVDSDN